MSEDYRFEEVVEQLTKLAVAFRDNLEKLGEKEHLATMITATLCIARLIESQIRWQRAHPAPTYWPSEDRITEMFNSAWRKFYRQLAIALSEAMSEDQPTEPNKQIITELLKEES